MKDSTYFRMFIIIVLIMFSSFFLLGGLSTILSYRRTMSERRDMMNSALHETARYVTTQHLIRDVNLSDLDLNIPLTMISRITGLDVLLTNTYGEIEASSNVLFLRDTNIIPPDILQSISSGEHTVMTTLGDIYPTRQLVTGMPLTTAIGGEIRTFGYLLISNDTAVSQREWINFTTAFILLSVSVMILAFIFSYFISKKHSGPIIEMASAARRFARGELDVRIEEIPDRKDEVEQLIKAFNYMADSIEHNEQLRKDFIANISHELKTPMTVIAGFAEGLLDGTIPKEDEDRYLSVISSETRRLSRLVKSMQEISLLGDASSQPATDSKFDITEVVRLTLLSLSGKIEGKKLDVKADLPDDPVITRGNKDQITQVVYNLIDNAAKYAYSGSVIKLELWQSDKKAFFSITNKGETIPEEELPYIFNRFHKTDKSRSTDRDSVGLGLYIVKTILDKLGEDIYVTSADGITKFIFSLSVA